MLPIDEHEVLCLNHVRRETVRVEQAPVAPLRRRRARETVDDRAADGGREVAFLHDEAGEKEGARAAGGRRLARHGGGDGVAARRVREDACGVEGAPGDGEIAARHDGGVMEEARGG